MVKNNKVIKILLLVCLIFLGISLGYIVLEKYEIKKSGGHVYSHRGASGEEIEHTFAAYDLAIKYGSLYIEQDLVTSKDKTLFVSHDLNAKRLTGKDKNYNELTDSEIKKIKTKNGENIHKLDEIFNKYENTINYVIELKENEEQVELFEQEVKKAGLEEKIIVQASNTETLKQVEQKFPEMKKLLLVKNQEILDQNIDSSVVDIFGLNKELMNPTNIEHIHQNKKEVNVWTLNSSEEIKKAIELNVDTYFTNFTGKALMIEKESR